MQTITADLLIIGTGIAALRAALEAQDYLAVTLITKTYIHEGSTELAQGGIAVAIDKTDKPKYHYEDTLAAGAGLCDETAVKVLVEEGPKRVQELIQWGANFDQENGELLFAQEAAHRQRRILHAGDSTGHEIEKTLGNKLLADGKVRFIENMRAIDLLMSENRCAGVLAIDTIQNEMYQIKAKTVLIASGGYGQIFSNNTSPPVNTGDGAAMAYRAGAELSDLEFVQFHPTTLAVGDRGPLPVFLISEAVRGEGAIIRNVYGEAFLTEYDQRAELAPRDIVSRAIFDEMRKTDAPYVYLDFSGITKNVSLRFPTIYKRCLEANVDIAKDFVPVSPAAHYCMGGIKTDHLGRTNIPGLYAAGEVAANYIHGANRLASNSLLEGLVFGKRAGSAIINYIRTTQPAIEPSNIDQFLSFRAELIRPEELTEIMITKQSMRNVMWKYVGIKRSEVDLQWALLKLNALSEKHHIRIADPAYLEMENMLTLAKLTTELALRRLESRGAHYRLDFPACDDLHWKKHQILQLIN